MRDKKTLFWLQSGSYSGDTLSILNMDDPDLFTQFKHMGIEVNLSPDLSTKPTMRFPVILTRWISQHEEALYRRTDHQSDQAKRNGHQGW